MTASSLYNILLKEQVCVQHRDRCDKNCKKCTLSIDTNTLNNALNEVIDIVRAKNPELYFSEQLIHLRKEINNAIKHQETRSNRNSAN